MKALIAAGGRATRFRPITWTVNKHLIPLANRPLIFNAIDKISEAGIKDIAININPGDIEMERVIGDGSMWGVNITYLEQQGGAKGIAHAVNNAREWIGEEPFIFYLGDNIVLGSLDRFVRRFEEEGLNCLLALSHVPNPTHLGVAEFDEAGNLVRIVEKPENPPSEKAVTGIYLYDKSFFEAFRHMVPSARGEYEISDVHTWFLQNGYKVGAEEITGWWKDTGMPKDFLEGNQLIMNEKPREFYSISPLSIVSDSAVIEGPVRIEDGSKICGESIVRGPVVIGKDVTIIDAYVGPYTSIGNNVKMSGVEIEHSIVLDESDIACNARIVDSILGKNTKVSNKADTLPRSGHRLIIGENSKVEL
jgi:glucose-1-phosphate thymidylyltransferase